MVFFAAVGTVVGLYTYGGQALHSLGLDHVFSSGFGESDDTYSIPTDHTPNLPGECPALLSRIHTLMGQFNYAVKNYASAGLIHSESQKAIWAEKARDLWHQLHATEVQYKQTCDPSYQLTQDRYFNQQ
jgi:hypothetical protein